MAAIVANCAISLNCELTRPVSVEYINGNVFSQDNAGNTVHVYVHYNGEPQEIVGSVSANVIRADGTTVAVPGAIQGNRAYVIFPQAVYAVPGVISVVVKVTEGTTVTTIAAFVANVYRSTTDVVVDPGTIIPSVQNLIAAIDAAIASIPADYSSLLADIAPTYSPDSPYPVVGTVVWYNGTLVQNKVPITTAESYDSDKWESANLAQTANQALFIAKEFPAAVGAATGTTPLAFEYGYYMSLSDAGATPNKTASAGWCCAFFDVVEGEKITLDATGSTGVVRLYGWVDAEGKVISRSTFSLSGKRTITAPEGAVKCIINNRVLNQPTGFYAYRGVAIADSLAETDAKFAQVSELVPAAKLTQNIDGASVNGLTVSTDGDILTIYGTADYTRRWCCINGQNALKITTNSFAKTLDPGTYYFDLSISGTQQTIAFHATYTTFASAFTVVSESTLSAIRTFDQPVMMGLTMVEGRNYGTAENPTVVTLTIKKLSAIDYTAREANETNAASVAAALADVATKAPAITEIASGHIAQFADGADMPLQKVTAYISETQAGTGEASSENIREITGRSAYKVNVCGRNLFGGERLKQGVQESFPNATGNETAGTVSFTAGTSVSEQYPYITDYCGLTGKFKTNTVYTIVLSIRKSAGINSNLVIEYADGSIQYMTNVTVGSKLTMTYTTTEGKTVRGIRKYNSAGTTTLYYDECAIVEGSIPRQGAIKGALYEIELPTEAGIVYGGILEINADGSGTLTVTRGVYVFDGAGSIGSVAESSTGIMAMASSALTDNIADDETLLSNQYAAVVIAPPESGTAIQSTSGAIIVYDNRFTDAETAAAICEENPIQVCYALATPIVYNFTAGQIKSVLGENNVWAETGTITLKYAADTKLYIDAAIAAAVGS